MNDDEEDDTGEREFVLLRQVMAYAIYFRDALVKADMVDGSQMFLSYWCKVGELYAVAFADAFTVFGSGKPEVRYHIMKVAVDKANHRLSLWVDYVVNDLSYMNWARYVDPTPFLLWDVTFYTGGYGINPVSLSADIVNNIGVNEVFSTWEY